MLPLDWQHIMGQELEKPYFAQLQAFVKSERVKYTVYPPEQDVFNAFAFTPYQGTHVLLLGQDPYHDKGQAHGLCFSVRPGIGIPPSLMNMFREIKEDVGFEIPGHGYLASWAEQGILMLNAVLTVRAHAANSHQKMGWETFTDAVIRQVHAKEDPVVFVLWGNYARKKGALIDRSRHVVIESAHPSPLSAHNGFFGSKPFSAVNRALQTIGKPEILWQLPDLATAYRQDKAGPRSIG